MFKFFLILLLIVFVLYKIGTFFYRIGAVSQHFRNFQQQKKNGTDQAPKNGGKKASKFNGGEYIDYEEVK